MRQSNNITDELNRKAAVEPEMRPNLRNRRGIRRRTGEQHGRITWESVRQQERHHDNADEAGDRAGDPPQDDQEHGGDFNPAHEHIPSDPLRPDRQQVVSTFQRSRTRPIGIPHSLAMMLEFTLSRLVPETAMQDRRNHDPADDAWSSAADGSAAKAPRRVTEIAAAACDRLMAFSNAT